MIEAVTPRDISTFVAKLLSSKPSLATYGDGTGAVKYDSLLARYAQYCLFFCTFVLQHVLLWVLPAATFS